MYDILNILFMQSIKIRDLLQRFLQVVSVNGDKYWFILSIRITRAVLMSERLGLSNIKR